MVKLTEVEDEHYSEKPTTTIDGSLLQDDDDDDYTDTNSELSDDLPSTLPDESLSDRLAALIDIIPPKTRSYLSSLSSSIYRTSATGISYSGKGLWVVCSSVLLLGLPYALAFGGEQEMVEAERQQGMMAEGASVMSGGGEVKDTL